ncbi:hypothetical protein SAMN05428945_5412 [Streptomyces sp. 2224.1]|nr:hypothetical protein BX261_7121 [Streptomyces sp. 2321.6]SDQ65113.1 hypothetical protein SAMN05216511_0129 [Streptomyces sp. KS_16]SED32520.1 hypothetical protein SAMN05428954_0095 [Streptomyces sp. 2112.3]SED75661.1 hypothetical protein SAMN05428945_5412 [Streptomyces sp. 2224.1]SEE16023.1 hypothetical protein SAMN05428940_7144 [Streptomyces sp. 2133.1]SNC74173.1 hypothetical protein SAMN06272741_7050 [Streptomyces sp. 2114.4]
MGNTPNAVQLGAARLPAPAQYTNARHRDVLAAERREGAGIRRAKGIRWGGHPLPAVA